VLILLAVGVPALRTRRRASRARRSQEDRRRDDAVALGSAATIVDPSGYTTAAVLKALAVRPEDHGPTDDEPWDEGWAGTMLGLRSKVSYATNVLEPHLYWGTRGGRQVFIRVGPDEKIEGGTTMFSNRHIRAITVVRVAAPAFTIESVDGALHVTSDLTPELEAVLAPLSASAETWSDTRITGGPDGLVATRNAIDGIENSWAYDLWLCERIADRLGLEPLAPARIGPAWKVPYGLGRKLGP
jgi:hypothetical protein